MNQLQLPQGYTYLFLMFSGQTISSNFFWTESAKVFVSDRRKNHLFGINPRNKTTYRWRQLVPHPCYSDPNWFTVKKIHGNESSWISWWFYHYFSKYRKIVNTMASVKRFIFKIGHLINRRQSQVNAYEKEKSEKTFLRCVQIEYFFRFETRVTERGDLEEFRYPILLPTNIGYTVSRYLR